VSTLVAILVDGIIYASWLFIIAAGLTMIYGVMRILNMAHGSLYALGAYVAASLVGAWLRGGHPPLGSYALLVLAAVLVGVVVGPVIERGLLRFAYGRDEVVLVLVTYALFLILEDAVKLVWESSPTSYRSRTGSSARSSSATSRTRPTARCSSSSPSWWASRSGSASTARATASSSSRSSTIAR